MSYFRDIALAIIQSKEWKSALRNSTISPLGEITTPLRKLIKKMPGEFFDPTIIHSKRLYLRTADAALSVKLLNLEVAISEK